VEPPIAPAVPRQRWRLYVAQPAAATPGEQAGGARGWASILAAAGLPLASDGGGRGRVVPAAPLPLGIAGEREVVDVLLAERLPVATVRDGVRSALPSGWRLVGIHDVWLGAPAAPAAVIAADYRVVVAGAARIQLEAAARELLAATTLPRERRREKRTTTYDLRPLLVALETRAATAAGVVLWMRLRHGPEAVGRPEEVVAALGEPPAPRLEDPLEVVGIVRERLALGDDEAEPPGPRRTIPPTAAAAG
jgi:radical SAM-linked protein